MALNFFGFWKCGLGGCADVLADGAVGFKISVRGEVLQDKCLAEVPAD